MMNFLPTLLLFLGGIILTMGDVFMKKWVGSMAHVYYVLGMLLYVVGLNFLAQSYRFENIAVASAILISFNLITLAIVSWLFFKEPLSGLQILGIVLGVASIVCLELTTT